MPATMLNSPARRAYGAAAIAGPLLLLASTIAFITAGDGINDGVLGGTLSVWAVIALGIALVGILRLLEPLAPRAAGVLTLTAIAGVAGGAAFSVGAIYLPIYDLGPDAPFDVVEGADAIATLAFLPWGWLIPLTLTLTGLMCRRTGAIPRRQAALLIAGGVLFVAGRPARIEPVAVLTDLVLVAALLPIGWTMLRSARPASAPSEPAAVPVA